MDTDSTTPNAVTLEPVRYRSRPTNTGWIVLDTWTGEPAQIGGLPQVGLSKADADHTAAMIQSGVAGASS